MLASALKDTSPGAIARCIGVSADRAPASEHLLEKLLDRGCSANEPAGVASAGEDGVASGLAPLLLLARKRVLRAGDRGQLVLGGEAEKWEAAVAQGPKAAIELAGEHVTATTEEGSSFASALHDILCEDTMPLSWWRVFHGVMCIIQLPRVDSFDEDGELPDNPTGGAEAVGGDKQWDDAFENLLNVRIKGGSSADVGGWRAHAQW